MSIYFDEQSKVFYLESKNLTYAFGINAIGQMEHVYFGKRTGRDLKTGIYCAGGRSHAVYVVGNDEKRYDVTVIPQEISTPYGGDYYEPSLILEYANGNRRSDLVFDGYEILKEKPALDGLPSLRKGETLAVTLKAKSAKVILYYTVSETSSIIARSMKVINEGTDNIRVNRAYSFAFSLPNLDW